MSNLTNSLPTLANSYFPNSATEKIFPFPATSPDLKIPLLKMHIYPLSVPITNNPFPKADKQV